MTPVFVDTSALIALLVANDRQHVAARRVFDHLEAHELSLKTSSYVLVETCALLQRRVGLEAVAAVRRDLAPLLDVVWVDAPLHEAALARVLTEQRRQLSLVDCVSFEIMEGAGIEQAFAFDRHFEDAGFELISAS